MADGVDQDDIGMIEFCDKLRFTEEARYVVLVFSIR